MSLSGRLAGAQASAESHPPVPLLAAAGAPLGFGAGVVRWVQLGWVS